jgi:hypothetical protein
MIVLVLDVFVLRCAVLNRVLFKASIESEHGFIDDLEWNGLDIQTTTIMKIRQPCLDHSAILCISLKSNTPANPAFIQSCDHLASTGTSTLAVASSVH